MRGLTRARPAPASTPRPSKPTRMLVVVNERALESNMLRRAQTFGKLLAPDFEVEVVSAPRRATLADARAAEIVYVIDPGKVGFPAVLRGWAARRPVVVEVGDPQADLYRAQARGRRSVWAGAAIDRIVGRYATAVVVRGGELADVLDLRVPWIEIPDGVDVERFRPGIDSGLRKQLGIPADALVVGLVGSLRRGRRPESTYGWDIVEVLSLLRDAPVFGLIVGDGDGLEALRARAAELGVADRAVMPGYVPHRDIAPYVAAMDVCVSRQTNDAVGRSRTTAKLPEYLACDRFVLATDVGGAAQVLPEEMLLPYSGSDDPEHSPRLAGRVRELVSRRQELRAGAGTRRIALEHYSYPALAGRLGAFLDEVASVRNAVPRHAGVAAREDAGSSPRGGKPRIVIVAHGAHDEGGMERVFAELIRRVHRMYDLVVISSELAPDLLPLVRWERTRVPRRPAPLRFCLFYVLAGLRVRRARRRGDLVHTCGALVPNRADFASVHFCHAGFREAEESYLDDKPMLRRINTAVANGLALAAEHWSYRGGRTRVLGAVSEGVAKELERAYPGARIVVTPNGVDPTHFRPDADARAEIRGSRGLDDGDLVALFVGGDWYRKGLGIVLDALPDAPGVRLWIVGRGDETAFRARAKELGVADRIEFLGAQPDVERYYQAADVFVLPSRYEAFPLVSLEAAACGLPLVVTHVSGVDELIGNGEAGQTVERSGGAVAAALRELSSDPGRRWAMGRAARQRASTFTWESSAESVLDVYGELRPSVREAEEVAA